MRPNSYMDDRQIPSRNGDQNEISEDASGAPAWRLPYRYYDCTSSRHHRQHEPRRILQLKVSFLQGCVTGVGFDLQGRSGWVGKEGLNHASKAAAELGLSGGRGHEISAGKAFI
jgi:hypothetical protein